jgi:hypothetical protein
MTQETYANTLCGCSLDGNFCQWPACQPSVPEMLDSWKRLPTRQTREIRLSSHPLVPEGKQVLWRNGEVVCIVSVGDRFGDQTGDVAFDHIQMNPADYARFEKASALPGKESSNGR